MNTSLLEISPAPRPWMEFPLPSYSSPKRIRVAFVRSRQVGDRKQWACAYSRLDHYITIGIITACSLNSPLAQ